ncbi:MAG: NAD(P)H-hydrate dehydratase [Myxococcota bacterium]
MLSGFVLTREEMQAADRWTIDELGLPSLVLMEVAGRAVSDAALRLGAGRPVLAVAGTGNNGADALVAARHLAEAGQTVHALVIGSDDRMTRDSIQQQAFLRRLGIRMDRVETRMAEAEVCRALASTPLVVDGVFGTGLSRPPEGPLAAVLHRLARASVPLVSVDIPSGVDANTGQAHGPAVAADVTVTFQFPKLGHVLHPGRDLAGRLHVADIGIPGRVLRRIRPLADVIAPVHPQARASTAHKGTFGHVLVVAGAPDKPGSALLMARGAQCVGAGLVTVGGVEETVRRLAPNFGSLMGVRLGRGWVAVERLAREAVERTVTVIGPSLPGDARTEKLLREAFGPEAPAEGVRLVLDAGALRGLEDGKRPDGWVRRRSGPTILTPHPGEMAALLDASVAEVQGDRVGAARRFSSACGSTVVLKGASTLVAEPSGRVGVCLGGNPGMGTAGAGDVLAGMVAGIWAQGCTPGEAARAGVWLHAAAGDESAARFGQSATSAESILEALRQGEPAHGQP